MATLTIKNEHLMTIIEALSPAAAPCLDEQPTAFMETMHIVRADDNETVLFTCTDGFRAHVAELPTIVVLDGEIVVGVDFLAKVCSSLDPDEHVTIVATNSHTKWEVSVGTAEQRFTIPDWPDMRKLISDETLGEEEVGFNLDYFHDMIDAFESWYDDPEEEGSMIPLRVHSMQRKRVNHFSMKNALGTLRVLLMPIILKDSEWR